MSASQARLLTLTNRLHDIEYKAQNIQAQKLALATQQDALYQEYCDALDAQNIMVARVDGAGNKSFVKASYATVCKYNSSQPAQFALKDTNTGKILVDSETKEMWDKFGNDPYSFAWAMLGFDQNFAYDDWNGDQILNPDLEAQQGQFVGLNVSNWNLTDAEDEEGNQIGTHGAQQGYMHKNDDGTTNVYMTQAEWCAYNDIVTNNKTGAPELIAKYEELTKAVANNDPQDEIQQKFDAFRKQLYSTANMETIFSFMNASKNHDDSANASLYQDAIWGDFAAEFKYYENLWTAINNAGGCVELEPTQEIGETAEDWFQYAVESGNAVIMQYTSSGSKQGWSDTSVATNTNSGYLKSEEDDTELKKAEAKYEHELKKINKKDANYDTELSKLETERTAITTEMDSIKSVKDENIDRTFNVFN